eukprot:CAMPEP_0114426624 /NCGR_PEP_ID=MMETSP0103-20121206/7901_1 /TAXON_ID=37642 ORGANISM="Paraphysomonas imperforata, Strain PA2" /NCGR_SAMPLE_ID=MMETSP0103 /ASSEMBLY_ACC=CAM_ASM_000201 /LENGTH=466 /DNA_ID=CAMNT_0001595605 /DNA_START=78 /DNA_END=1475 /DNA_ORIENTATION=-
MSTSETGVEEPVVNEKAQKASDELTNGMLMDQLEELEEQKTKLLLNLKECKEKYEQQKSDQTDIYYYLNKKLDENYETIALLEEQILNEQAQREIHEKKLEKRIEELEVKLVADELKYKNKLKEAEEKLQKLKDFNDNKDELEKNFEKLLETLEVERKHYSELVDENERKSIRERDRFRKDCVAQFEEHKQKLQEEADDKLSSKTKKTLKTNKLIKTELTYQSKQADQVLMYNKKVLDKDRELRQELELTQTTQKEMVRRLALYQRLIKQLNEKVNSQETMINELKVASSSDIKEKDEALEAMQRQLSKAQKRQMSSKKNSQDAFVDFLSNKFKDVTTSGGSMSKDTSKAFVKSNVDKIMNEILLHALHNHPERFAHVLEDRPMEFFPPIHSSNFNGTGTSDQASGGERKQLLTGISAWDSARASSNGNWWSALSADSGPQNQECVTTQGIQTEGRISHYPAGSKW